MSLSEVRLLLAISFGGIWLVHCVYRGCPLFGGSAMGGSTVL